LHPPRRSTRSPRPTRSAKPNGRLAPPPFTVAIIARNEAGHLPELLDRLKRWRHGGGEVLVVDTGSTDATVEVARGAGCRVEEAGERFHFLLSETQAAEIQRRFGRQGEGPLVSAGERVFRFGEARQYAGLLARHDHVLQLDASDRLEAFDARFLAREIRAGRASRFGYRLEVGGCSLRIVRFYDRRLDHWQGCVHEVLYEREPGRERPPTVECTPDQLAVRHERNDVKPRAYVAGLALDVLAQPDNPRWRYYLGRELYYHRFYHSALGALAELSAMRAGWSTERSDGECLSGRCLEALGRHDEAGERYARAFRIDSRRREPLLLLAELCRRRDDFQGGVAWAAAALAIPRTSPFPEADANYGAAPHRLLYWGLYWLKRRDEAREHWLTCRRLEPDDPKIREDARFFTPVAARPRKRTG
jgi:glycosyltransferase involved in cell wall biosynthesis